ncbi:MAG: hypothetical protein K6D97_00680 [Clostridia bacterium]|nr:hypothetical protein [Clostridia bacterium]
MIDDYFSLIEDEIEIEILEDGEYEYEKEFKEEIEGNEERDEEVLKTRDIKEIDKFRLEAFPDYVNCVVPYKNTDYSAKVKLEKIEGNTIYAKYHNKIGVLELINENNSQFLIFKPIEETDESKGFKEYVETIIDAYE